MPLWVGCVPDEPQPPLPPEPSGPTIGAARTVTVELLLDQPVDFVASDSVLGLYVGIDTGLVTLDPLASEPAALGAEAGSIGGLCQLPGGELLVSGSQGLFVSSDDGLVASPLNEALPSLGASSLFAVTEGTELDLWIISSDQLLLWRAGEVFDLQPEGLPASARSVVFGELNGSQALWVGAGEQLYALVEDDGFTAYPRAGDFAVSSLAADSYGTLWAATDGSLWGRWPDGTEEALDLPFATLGVSANEHAGELWITTDDGLWLHEAGVFRPIEGAPEGVVVGTDAVGRALVSGEAGLSRLSAGRPLLFLGVADGSELEDLATLHLLPTVTPDFVGLTALLDGEPVTVDTADGWSLVLDPDLLSDGAHEVQATADYGKDELVVASLYFSVGEFIPPTWSADIEPLFQAECALCHSATGGATTAGGGHPIDSLAAWQTEIEEILHAVSEGLMPLNAPPFDEQQIGLVEDWRAGGFLE